MKRKEARVVNGMILHRAKVRMDAMDPGDYVLGWADDIGWNGFARVWLEYPALYALDKSMPIFEPTWDNGPYIRVEGESGNWHFFDVADGHEDESELPRVKINDVWHWDMGGWTFEEVDDD